MADSPIEQFVQLAQVLIGASIGFAGGDSGGRPDHEVLLDIRKVRTACASLITSLDWAERSVVGRPQPPAPPPPGNGEETA